MTNIMTKDEIIALAREAGGLPDPMVFIAAYERFATLVIQESRKDAEPVAWRVNVDIANYQGQSEYRTILAFRPDPTVAGNYEVIEVISAEPLYTHPAPQPTQPPGEALLRQALYVLESVEALIEHKYTGTREAMDYLQNTADYAQEVLGELRTRLGEV